MSSVIEPLVMDLVRWCAREQRSYEDVIEAWRTSCPRLMVWEEAVGRGLLETRAVAGAKGLVVVVTARGRELAGNPDCQRRVAPPPRPAFSR